MTEKLDIVRTTAITTVTVIAILLALSACIGIVVFVFTASPEQLGEAPISVLVGLLIGGVIIAFIAWVIRPFFNLRPECQP
jgi:hypothetical protein